MGIFPSHTQCVVRLTAGSVLVTAAAPATSTRFIGKCGVVAALPHAWLLVSATFANPGAWKKRGHSYMILYHLQYSQWCEVVAASAPRVVSAVAY
jgi:hypothetical protein